MRKKRLANGKLRPAQQRYREKKNKRRRAEWLANFEPGAREQFFAHVVVEQAVWLAAFQKQTGVERDEAARALERLAEARRWRKLRTKDGTVVGIAPPKPDQNQWDPVVLPTADVGELPDATRL